MDGGFWITRDGTRVPIRAMKRSHILSCIDLIQRRNWRREYLARLQLELKIRDFLGEQH
jgi:hypothetical protein